MKEEGDHADEKDFVGEEEDYDGEEGNDYVDGMKDDCAGEEERKGADGEEEEEMEAGAVDVDGEEDIND